ncbi:MupA/Atu3671 family FMN-dependent luciferase-like monooxygenase [Micromonospora sp. CA-246542]|uniref:MupA/Atu3671 family FMN-dependent luciferase-like monooxygenase n=1 Tax=Micromonospora sp. CA-246542 TaxID=3239959 RepID=UPI003D8E3CF6
MTPEIAEQLGRLTPEQRAALRKRLRNNQAPPESPVSTIDRLSLYFFPAAGDNAADYYDMILRAAERADEAGFAAVWLPERHFVRFGGFSPNPAVLAAAVAARTDRIGIRAGSVAAPLHHPVRIAEEWSVVDNLSRGRVGVSFASGWHPDDFVLARTDHATRRDDTLAAITQVRSLWSGAAESYPSTAGGERAVRIRPRPIQQRLPVWLTAAGSPDTFVAAGSAGCGVMTALLGQTLGQLRENVERYRAAWRAAGHPGSGDVVVMTHAYVSDRPDLEAVLRPAMHDYLEGFLAQTAETGGADRQTLLEQAYQSYLHGTSLLGTPAKARRALAELSDAGADEVGCLVDFGLPADTVLDGLSALAALIERVEVSA